MNTDFVNNRRFVLETKMTSLMVFKINRFDPLEADGGDRLNFRYDSRRKNELYGVWPGKTMKIVNDLELPGLGGSAG